MRLWETQPIRTSNVVAHSTEIPLMDEDANTQPAYRYNGLAIYALIMGVLSPLWIVFGLEWVTFGVLAVFAGLRARHEVDSAHGKIEGRSLATAAIIAGGFGLTTAVFILLVVLVTPPV